MAAHGIEKLSFQVLALPWPIASFAVREDKKPFSMLCARGQFSLLDMSRLARLACDYRRKRKKWNG